MRKRSGYIVGGLLARGGMAEIFLGKSSQHMPGDDLCAIKRILPQYHDDTEFIKMFSDEARISMRLNHPNLVRVSDFQKVDGAYAMIMEFVNGGDLRSILAHCEQKKTALTVPMAIYIAAEAAKGLHFAHCLQDELTQQPLGIIHRDISPQNILISFDGQVKVTDFGIADSDNKQSETKPGIVKGKYSYMSPEQVMAKDLDPRTDVFSLSIVLWEMLALKRLFSGKNEVDTIRKVQACKIDVDLQKLNPNVDLELMQIINRGLAKDPQKRHASSKDMGVQLLAYLGSQYPDFSPAELAHFLSEIMAERRQKVEKLIQDTTNAKNTERTIPPEVRANINHEASRLSDSQTSRPLDSQLTRYHEQATHKQFEANLSHELKNKNSLLMVSPDVNDGFMSPSYRAQFSSSSISSQPNSNRSYSQLKSASPQIAASAPKFFSIGNIAIIGIALLMISAFLKRRDFTPEVELIIHSNPKQVQITIDGQQVSRGRYITTPTKIKKLKTGNFDVTISRKNYQPYQFRLPENHEGQQLNRRVQLEPEPGITFSPVSIRVRGARSIPISVDDGYFSGNAPTQIKDLPYGKSVDITISPNQGGKFRCRFTPKATSDRFPLILTIDVSNSRQRCLVKSP